MFHFYVNNTYICLTDFQINLIKMKSVDDFTNKHRELNMVFISSFFDSPNCGIIATGYHVISGWIKIQCTNTFHMSI